MKIHDAYLIFCCVGVVGMSCAEAAQNPEVRACLLRARSQNPEVQNPEGEGEGEGEGEVCGEADPTICSLGGHWCAVCSPDTAGDSVIVGDRYRCGFLSAACPAGWQWVQVQNP